MCGLAGFAGAGGRGDLEAMTRLVAHRGPDGEGFFLDREMPVFLGHQRLAIIDVAGGAQPMASPDGQIVVVYNGEIYNYRELRSGLIAKGHVFRTDHSDTEVLDPRLAGVGNRPAGEAERHVRLCHLGPGGRVDISGA